MPKPVTKGVPAGQIRKAISQKFVVTFTYAGLDRTCEVHVYGMTNGQDQILCWQVDGLSKRGGLPNWRRFDVAYIENFEITTLTHGGFRPVPYPHSVWDQVYLTV